MTNFNNFDEFDEFKPSEQFEQDGGKICIDFNTGFKKGVSNTVDSAYKNTNIKYIEQTIDLINEYVKKNNTIEEL